MSAPLSAPTAGADGGPQRRQFWAITFAAIGVFALLRLLPTGTDLSHMDFRVDAKDAIEFCDPSNPQFIPVVAVRSPVTMEVRLQHLESSGREHAGVVQLRTASGKPLGPADLLVVHTQPLHLLIVDPSLGDYQHVHPSPGKRAGEWNFAFTPRSAGTYRFFADFTPAATARGLYASADVAVPGGAGSAAAPIDAAGSEATADGFRFSLQPAAGLRAGQPGDLVFAVARGDGAEVALEPVMDAYAHLVAFDPARTGFAHLHPADPNPASKPSPTRPELRFKLTIPQAGKYVVWAQVKIAGRERFVPFTIEVSA